MMQRVATLYRSSVGKKILMAVTGIILFVFIVLHVIGNLKVLLGPDELNDYARFLRTVGYPAVPNKTALWTVRIVLLISVLVHINAALQTWLQSRKARQHGYRKNDDLSFSWASRTMRWGGVIILVFVIYHIGHFTTGTWHPDFVEGDVYHNLVAGFQTWPVVLAYVVATAALMFHLYHGIWSALQTLGLNHPQYNAWRRGIAAAVAVILFAGFATVPVAVQLGILK